MNNNTLHTWTSTHSVMSHAHLLRDSSVLFPYVVGNTSINVPMSGGGLQIIKWDGTVAWDYHYYSSTFVPHHDVEPVYYTNDSKETPSMFVICATKENTNNLLAEKIVELKPSGTDSATIKWVWFAYDHSTSGGTDKPELLDLAMGYETSEGSGGGGDWLHMNSVSYNPHLDQLIVGVNWFEEFIVLDHGTTTAQAATHTGGTYGKGGDILYRWGHPSNYGCTGTQILFRPHGASWIPHYMPGTRKALPGAGNVLDISNNTAKGYEVTLPGTAGVYARTAGSAYGPASAKFSFDITGMGSDQGSIQRLPNGNTLVSKGASTGVLEVDSIGAKVWTMDVAAKECFRYDSSYLGSTVLDGNPTGVAATPQLTHTTRLRVSAIVSGGQVRFSLSNRNSRPAAVAVYSVAGKLAFQTTIVGNKSVFALQNRAPGLYLVRIACDGDVYNGQFIIN
jgi:hypothetical protein